MRYSHIEAFRAVMISGSTTAAAGILHTSQPNVSRSISQLEKETGLKLFDRLPGKLVPTSDALSFFNEVQRSFAGLQRLEEAAKRIRRFSGGHLRIAAIQILALGLIPRTVKRFSQIYPEVSISIHTGHSTAVSQWVDDHTCDLGIVSHLNGTYEFDNEELYRVEAVCVLPQGHRLATKACITPADLAEEPYIALPRNEIGYSAIDDVFQNAGVTRHINLETSYSSITCALVAQGLGVAIVNPLVALDYNHMGIVTRPFMPKIIQTAKLIYRKERAEARLIARFIETLKIVTLEDQNTLGAAARSADDTPLQER